MPFKENNNAFSPLALPEGFGIQRPETESAGVGETMGAALRLESPVISELSDFEYDRSVPRDPTYRAWEDIQGTKYEDYAERFVEARNREQVNGMKAQIDREIEDRSTLDAAGGWGMLASMGAAMLSPSTLLPGGAVAKGAKGANVARTAANVGAWAGMAALADEVSLHQSQATRTEMESAFAIGGSVILGGMLGSGAGAMSRRKFAANAKLAEQLPDAVREFDGHLQSLSAAKNDSDFTVRREEMFQWVNKTPVLRGVVRTDPILRTQLSDLMEVRSALSQLAETPLQWRVNEIGERAGGLNASVETIVKTRRNTELSSAMGHLNRAFAEYANDGDVGTISRITAPIKANAQSLIGKEGKWSSVEFMEEVGKAMFSGDKHFNPHVEKAAQQIRKEIFDKIKQDAIDVGIFDEGLQLKYGESYLSRVYNSEKIAAHVRDGTDNDITVLLDREFKRKRAEAEERLAFDDTVSKLEGRKHQAKERGRTARTAFNKAMRKAKDKKARAKSAIKREEAVGRVTGSLRKIFKDRADNLKETLMEGDELAAFKEMLKEARGAKKNEPEDMLSLVRRMGGLRDDGSGELQAALDSSSHTVKRPDGMHADDMRATMEELGYLPEGSTEADFWDALSNNARGEKVYSIYDSVELSRFEAAQEFLAAMDELKIDIDQPIEKIIRQLPGKSNRQKITRAKAGEANKSSKRAGKSEGGAEARLLKAVERLEDVEARLAELEEVIGPKVADEISEAQEELKQIIPELKKAKDAQSADEYYAGLDDLEITDAVDDAVNAILGLKPGQHSYGASLSSPTRARTLDVSDDLLLPWLNTNVQDVMGHYFNSMLPDIELTRQFGGVDFRSTEAYLKIRDEYDVKRRVAKSEKERTALKEELEQRVKDLEGMMERIRGVYGVPNDPNDGWVRGGRIARSLSYMGYLGGMTLSAIPDVAGMIGRNGLEAAFGPMDAITNPKRFKMALDDQFELGSAAEWYLNSRATSMFEVFEPYGRNSKFERGLDKLAHGFGVGTGMVPWNVAWKTIGGAMSASKMSKAAMAVADDTVTKSQLLKLSENGIDRQMAVRIAKQVQQHGDMEGHLWLPKGANWDDAEAFTAFKQAMNREMDLMVITPGQDKPLSFSSEAGKFFSQFKSFAVSSHHRILLSGLQRSDGAVLSQLLMAVTLGMVVSRFKAGMGGYEQKEGSALWLDALDRSGVTGILMEVTEPTKALANAALRPTTGMTLGEPTSRFMGRSMAMGTLGPSVDMGIGLIEGVTAMGTGKMTERDAKKLLRPLPYNNHPIAQIMDMTGQVARTFKDTVND
jgi:hypothetical protein